MKQVNGKRVFKLTGYVEMAPRYFMDRLVEDILLFIFSLINVSLMFFS